MQVNITKRIDTPEGKRYNPVIVGPNGRIKPDWVMVNDRQERHPEGAYYLDWNEDGKRKRISVGTDAAAAYNIRASASRRSIVQLAKGARTIHSHKFFVLPPSDRHEAAPCRASTQTAIRGYASPQAAWRGAG